MSAARDGAFKVETGMIDPSSEARVKDLKAYIESIGCRWFA